jgi:hypothetical protein
MVAVKVSNDVSSTVCVLCFQLHIVLQAKLARKLGGFNGERLVRLAITTGPRAAKDPPP